MDTWTPLFSSLPASSIWGESAETRVVWITMLSLKDRGGFVAASVPGLARLSVVTVKECEEALRALSSPDPYSKCTEHEGRRIQAVDGGWVVLGHARFQALMRDVSTKVGNAKRQREFRKRKGSKPIKGEAEYVEASKNGEGDRQLDRIVEKHLPT